MNKEINAHTKIESIPLIAYTFRDMMSVPGRFTVTKTFRFSTRVADELQSLRQEEALMDFKIHILEQTIHCHRLVLCLHSPVLKAMILTEMKEGTSQEMRLDTIPYPVMITLVDYMYCGNVTFSNDHLIEVIQACDYLQLLELRDLCIARAPHILTPANAISWLRLAHQLNIANIKTKCCQLMSKNFTNVTRETEFLSLTHEEVMAYLQDAQKQSVDSDDLLRAALMWTAHDSINRAGDLQEALMNVKVEKCTMNVLKEMMMKHSKLLDQQPTVFKLFTSSLISIVEQIQLDEQQISTQSRGICVIGGHHGTEKNNRCWKVDDDNVITEMAAIPDDMCAKYNSICVTPHGFLLTGGENSSICVMFYMATQSWRKLKNMLRTRYCHGSAFVKGTAFVVSEYNHGKGSCSMDYLDVEEGKWQEGPAAPAPLPWPKVSSMDGDSIYILDSTSSLYQLDVQSKAWVRRASLPGRGWSVSMAAGPGGKLFVAGGRNNICFCYTASTDTWAQVMSAPSLRHYDGTMSTVTRRNKTVLMLLGGGSSDVEECNVEEDDDEHCWSVSHFKLPMAIKFHAAFQLPANA